MRFPSRHLAAVVLTLAGSGGCAVRPAAVGAPVATTSSSATIDALIGRGCFGCLTQAYNAAIAASNRTRTFEAALLLTARAKELGLPYGPWLERARAVLPEGPDWSDYLAIVQALRIDPLADDRDAVLVETLKNRASAETIAGWRTDLGAGAGSPLLRAYLELSLICQYVVADRNVTIAATVQRFHDVPLIEYRAGACSASQAPHLTAVREAVPEFADVDLPLGRYALDIPRQPDQDEALRRFIAARAAFPESPAIVASLAALRRDREEWTDALEAYDAAL